MQFGVVCVRATGISRMHLWFADNLDTQLQVRMIDTLLVTFKNVEETTGIAIIVSMLT